MSDSGSTLKVEPEGKHWTWEVRRDTKDGRDLRWPLGAESDSQPTASKVTCTSGRQPQGTGFCGSPE